MIRGFVSDMLINYGENSEEAEENQSLVSQKSSGKKASGRRERLTMSNMQISKGRIENCPNNLIQFIVEFQEVKCQGHRQDQLHKLQGPVQNENAQPLLQKLLRISRWLQKEIKPTTGPNFPELFRRILAAVLQNSYYYSHFLDKGTDAQCTESFNKGHRARPVA